MEKLLFFFDTDLKRYSRYLKGDSSSTSKSSFMTAVDLKITISKYPLERMIPVSTEKCVVRWDPVILDYTNVLLNFLVSEE